MDIQVDENSPRISIIIPIYNTEKYLCECLDSVLNQTLTDIEIICINDGSTDGSLAILREYEAKDTRIKVIDKRNEGPSAARNLGLDLARGEYIQFVDSDDIIAETLCEKAYGLAIADAVDMVVFNITNNINKKNLLSFTSFPSEKNDKIWLLKTMPGPYTKIARREVYNKYCIRFPLGVKFGEDRLVHWLVCCRSNSFSVLKESLYFYRINSNSLCHRDVSYAFSETFFSTYSLIKQYLEKIGAEEKIFHHFIFDTFLNFWITYMRIQEQDTEKARAFVSNFLHENDYRGFIKDAIKSSPMLSTNGAIRLYFFYKMMQGSKFHALLFRMLTKVMLRIR